MWQIQEIDDAIEASIGYAKMTFNFLYQSVAKTNSGSLNLVLLTIL